jgi:hypothetical protein
VFLRHVWRLQRSCEAVVSLQRGQHLGWAEQPEERAERRTHLLSDFAATVIWRAIRERDCCQMLWCVVGERLFLQLVVIAGYVHWHVVA